jgi:hypothetical protein
MSFTPVVLGSGLGAWRFLKATQESQQAAFDRAPVLKRDTEYFARTIGNIESAAEFVQDRRLMRVALGAFGLEDKIDAKELIRRVIEEGTEDEEALANRLGDGRYVALAEALRFETRLQPKTQEPGFGTEMIARYREAVLDRMEAGLAETGDSDSAYGASVRAEVARNIEAETAFFRANIGTVEDAQGLVGSPRLYTFTLLAFGLEDRAGSTGLIRRVLEQGSSAPHALAHALGDPRYTALAETFAFDRKPASVMAAPGAAEGIVAGYYQQAFEVAVGEIDEGLRTALNFERAIPELAEGTSSESTKWFQVLGTTSLRRVFETALGLPAGFSQIDIDRQVETLQDKMQSRFGVSTFAEIAEPRVMERMIHSYLLQDQLQQGGLSAGQTALSLLQSIPRGTLPV